MFLKIIANPKKILLITIILLIVNYYLVDFINSIIPFLFIIIIVFLLFASSIINSLYNKMWAYSILSLFTYGFIMAIFLMLFVLKGMSEDHIILGSSDFYISKLKSQTGIQLPNKTYILCKNDSIIGIGPNGGEYTASCIFELTQKEYIKIENMAKKKPFKKIPIEDITSETRLDDKCYDNNSYIKAYKINYSFIALDKDKKHMLFTVCIY